MSEDNKKPEEDDIVLVEVDENDKPITEEAGEAPSGEVDEADEDTEEGDARLADEDDADEAGLDTAERNRRRREQRKVRRARAMESTQEELRLLREQNNLMAQRLASVEQGTVGLNIQTLAQQREKHLADARMADDIRGRAISAGNGEDMVTAERIRDAAIAEARKFDEQIQQAQQAMQQRAQPAVDPTITNYAKAWMDANPWYDPSGADSDSSTTKRIDAELVREGFNPATRSYWQELTARVAEEIGDDAPAARKRPAKGPPVGASREHAPQSTRKNEIRVTPERKQAMVAAGVWDDPIRRNEVLKAYRDFDNGTER